MKIKKRHIKLLICMGIIICNINTANAQSTTPKKNIYILVAKPTVIQSSATGNHTEKKVTVKVWIEKDKELGYIVYFKASEPLGNVEIKGTNPVLEPSITMYNGTADNGWFVLDAPTYKGRQSYTLTFFAQGMPDAIWTAAINIKDKSLRSQHLQNHLILNQVSHLNSLNIKKHNNEKNNI